MSMVRPEEFGKEHGLVHEAVVTGRKVGADRFKIKNKKANLKTS